jgi:hypothetical protein
MYFELIHPTCAICVNLIEFNLKVVVDIRSGPSQPISRLETNLWYYSVFYFGEVEMQISIINFVLIHSYLH